jgi:hypothetical protein
MVGVLLGAFVELKAVAAGRAEARLCPALEQRVVFARSEAYLRWSARYLAVRGESSPCSLLTALTGWLLCAALRGVVGCSVQFRATSTLRTGVSGFYGIPCPSRWTMRCVSTGGIMGRAGAAVSRRSVALV